MIEDTGEASDQKTKRLHMHLPGAIPQIWRAMVTTRSWKVFFVAQEQHRAIVEAIDQHEGMRAELLARAFVAAHRRQDRGKRRVGDRAGHQAAGERRRLKLLSIN
jgi:hypothetical protein